MNELTLNLVVYFGVILIFMTLALLYFRFVHRKYLRLLAKEKCPSCKLELGSELKMEQRFNDVKNRVQWNFPVKVNLTSIWPVTCPNCSERHVYNFSTNKFEPW